jgi:hypothetical protein
MYCDLSLPLILNASCTRMHSSRPPCALTTPPPHPPTQPSALPLHKYCNDCPLPASLPPPSSKLTGQDILQVCGRQDKGLRRQAGGVQPRLQRDRLRLVQLHRRRCGFVGVCMRPPRGGALQDGRCGTMRLRPAVRAQYEHGRERQSGRMHERAQGRARAQLQRRPQRQGPSISPARPRPDIHPCNANLHTGWAAFVCRSDVLNNFENSYSIWQLPPPTGYTANCPCAGLAVRCVASIHG